MSNIAILIKNKSIELIVPDQSKKLEFLSDTLQNQEILDSRKYTGLITNFFNENNLHEESVVILLSQEILYEKDISFKTPEEEEKEIMDFLNTIPFDNKKIALVKIPEAETEKVIATNRELYSFLMDVCVLLKLQVEAVVPLKILGEIDKNAVSWKTIPPLVEKVDLASPFNFLSAASRNTQNDNKKYFVAIFVGFLLVVLIFLAEYYLKSREQQNNQAPLPNITFKTEPSPASESSPSTVSISKDKLTIEVLNGSGVAGQASEIRNKLLKLGYSIIETGNFEGTASAQTTVSFSDKVSTEVQDEITKLLKTDFSDVATIKYSPANFEIIITTGTK